MALNKKQRAFIRLYRELGNATEAYIRAGYKSRGKVAGGCASDLLRKPEIAAELLAYEAELARQEGEEAAASIATVEECFRLWTSIMRDEKAERRERLRASELRAKAAGAFLERREVSGPGGGPQQHVVKLTYEQALAGATDGSIPGEEDDDAEGEG